MNPFSWPAETWSFGLSLAAMFFVALSVVTSLGALYASRIVGKREADKRIELETNLAKAQGETTIAKSELLTLRERVELPVSGRVMTNLLRCASLQHGPRGTVEIVYQEASPDAYSVAIMINHILKGFGWNAPSEPRAIPSVLEILPDAAKFTAKGITLLTHDGWDDSLYTPPLNPPSKTGTYEPNSPESVLFGCLGYGGSVNWIADPTIPKGTVHVVIGPNP